MKQRKSDCLFSYINRHFLENSMFQRIMWMHAESTEHKKAKDDKEVRNNNNTTREWVRDKTKNWLD